MPELNDTINELIQEATQKFRENDSISKHPPEYYAGKAAAYAEMHKKLNDILKNQQEEEPGS